ncbi:MAG: hypothetical protein L6R37_002692 [Teloschistes peruensis]|nr:MAG: hypothetical protein L6R37_002692 [Teloschistes peruensis]
MSSQKRSRAAFEADLQNQQSPYVFYGTPLPPLDPQTRDDGSYVPVWKQEVTDEKGRKRLHGAFTGGFSAGYFNTVGSKEGWAPSTFVSSRKDKQRDGSSVAPTKAQQRPEDFMDKEDLADAEEQRKVQTANSFAGFGTSAEHESKNNKDFMGIFRPTGETMGVKLLKKMGWREGQGIGPKVRRKAMLEELDDPGASETHLFAPEDSRIISIVKKADVKGLGFEGEGHLDVNKIPAGARDDDGDEMDASMSRSANNSMLKAKKKPQVRGGFGIGILNDTGSDDEDPYNMGPKISYNRVMGCDKKVKKKLETAKPLANPLLRNKPVFISKKAAFLSKSSSSNCRRCHDGRLPLDGFVLSNDVNSNFQDVKYPAPTVPEGWKSSKTPSIAPTDNSSYRSAADVAKASMLSPSSRSALLGETALPGKSVFDYLTPNARSRIASATNNNHLPPALSEASKESSTPKTLHSLIPALGSETALTALGRGIKGWMPYVEDLAKRSRYRLFLEIRAGLKPEGTLPEKVAGMRTDDWIKEMQEFAHAAQIFKPMTGMMATRFTSSSGTAKMASDLPDKDNEDGGGAEGEATLLRKPHEKPEDPALEAARLGMYGPVTRTIKEFYPTRLLCKRFNIRPPAHVQVDPGPEVPPTADFGEGEGGERPRQSDALPQRRLELVGKRDMEELMRERKVSGFEGAGDVGEEVASRASRVVIDAERNEALERDRPGEEVFKAIFGSDSEDE